MQTTIISGIYQIRNLVNNKIYVGSTVNFEWRKFQHFESLNGNCHHSKKLQHSFNKHREENFIFEIIESIQDKQKLIEREQFYFDLLKPDYNMCPIAGSSLGYKHSDNDKQIMSVLAFQRAKNPEYIKKLSIAHIGKIPANKGKKTSDEIRKKISEACKGKKRSEESLRKMAETNTGRKYSEETKRKISESLKRRNELKRQNNSIS